MRYSVEWTLGFPTICGDDGSSFSPESQTPQGMAFRAWLAEQGTTLEAWLAAHPAPVPPVNTIAEKRREAYRTAWSADEFQEAVLEHLAGRPEKLAALSAKRETIRAEIR